MQLLLMGYAASNDVRNVPLAVIDQDRSPAARRLLNAYRAADYFLISYDMQSEEELEGLLDSGKAGAGLILLGSHAKVEVDSFPDEVFDAVITWIANRAEFTPRNVQTEEGRRITVLAVQLSVNDSSGKLKPSMPADVTFNE